MRLFLFWALSLLSFGARADLYVPKADLIKKELIKKKLVKAKSQLRYNRVAKIPNSDFWLLRVWDEVEGQKLPWRVAYNENKKKVFVISADAVLAFNLVTKSGERPIDNADEAIHRAYEFALMSQPVDLIYVAQGNDKTAEQTLFHNYNVPTKTDARTFKPVAKNEGDVFAVDFYVIVKPDLKLIKDSVRFAFDGHIKTFDMTLFDKPPQ